MIGQTVSHYRITEKLGAGGMGVVYKAQDLRLPRFVALKFLPPHLSTDEIAKSRFIHEAEAASSLDHPNIGTIYEIDETDDGQMFIAMACYEGPSLQQKMAEGPVSVGEALNLTAQIASGLAKAHESGILHRDIKPGNVLLTEDGHAKIVDFGLAKLAGQTRVTRTGTTVGTISYMSPEQASGDEVDSRSDVFSAGVVLYELLTGELPFRGDHEAAVIYSIVNREPASLDSYRGDLPADAQRVIDKALAKDRDDRYRSATELLADLRKLQEGRQVATLERKAKRKIGRRAAAYGAVGVVIFAAVLAVISQLVPLQSDEPGDDVATISLTAVAVFPFAVRGSDEFADLGEGMMDLLSTKLDGAGSLRSVDPRSLMSYVKRRGGSTSDPELGREVATEFGAGLFLLGDIMAVGGRLNINASLYEVSGDAEPVASATVEGEADQVLGLVDDLAAQLLKDRLGETTELPFDLDAVTTKSYPALKAYLAGETKFRGDDFGGALSAFQLAVDEDSTFALAWYRLAVAWSWTTLDEERLALVMRLVDRADRHSQGLPELERLRIQALRADLDQDDEQAEQLYRTIVSNYPDDFEAWLSLGVMQQSSAFRRGRSPSEAQDALERALALDRNNWRILFQWSWFSAFERNYGELERLISLAPFPLLNRALVAFGVGDRAAQDSAMIELAGLDDDYLADCVGILTTFTDDLVRSRDIARLLSESLRADEVRGLGHIILAYLEAARGRWRAAKEELQRAESLNPVLAWEYGALLAASPFLPVSESKLQSMRYALTVWDAENIPASTNPSRWLTVHNDMHPQLRVYLLGLLNICLGDHEKAIELATEMEQMDGKPQVTGLMRDLAYGLRAQVAWRQGNLERALAEIEQIQMKSPANFRFYSPFFKQSHERFMRAELLHELGRDEEALGWTSSFGDINGVGFVYRAPIHLRRAEYYEQDGQPDKAAEHYAQFIEIWQDCDEELRPLVEEARSKLIALTSGEG